MITIIAVRHGQSDHNVAHIFNTKNDPISHLTEAGKDQAEETAQALKDQGVSHLFVSELIRAQETAAIINKQLKLQVKTDARINEWRVGYHGKSTLVMVFRYLANFMNTKKRYGKDSESLDEAKERIADFINDAGQLPDGSKVCIVAHKHTLQTLDSIIGGKNYRFSVLSHKIHAHYNTYTL